MHRKLFRDALGAQGFDVLELADGTHLWDAIENAQIDAALIDIYLPQIDGVTVIAKLRERWDAATLPIIGISAMPYHDIERRCIAAGADVFFTKPVGMRVLATSFAGLLDACH